MIQEADIGRHFGLTWTVESEWVDPLAFGEFMFVSKEHNAAGGQYYIIHDWEVGDFQLLVAGGQGPDVWDWPLGYFRSPLQAMLFAGRDAKYEAREARREAEQLESWAL